MKDIEIPGPDNFIRGHANTRYVWSHSIIHDEGRHELTSIDLRTLKAVASIAFHPGQAVTDLKFPADGQHALVTPSGEDGFMFVYDSATFEKIKRLPMSNPTQLGRPPMLGMPLL